MGVALSPRRVARAGFRAVAPVAPATTDALEAAKAKGRAIWIGAFAIAGTGAVVAAKSRPGSAARYAGFAAMTAPALLLAGGIWFAGGFAGKGGT